MTTQGRYARVLTPSVPAMNTPAILHGTRGTITVPLSSVRYERLRWEASASNEVYPHLYDAGLFATEIKGLITVEEKTESPGV